MRMCVRACNTTRTCSRCIARRLGIAVANSRGGAPARGRSKHHHWHRRAAANAALEGS